MPAHDPFTYIFRYLDLTPDHPLIPSIRNKMSEIHLLFNAPTFSPYDYSDPLFQTAYLIEYFPVYIDPIDDALSTVLKYLVEPDSGNRVELKGMEDKSDLELAFYGGGAEPELLGLSKFIKREFRAVQSLKTHCIDTHTWDRFRDFSHKYMIPDYWGKSFNDENSIRLDLCNIFEDSRTLEVVSSSDVHIMQNCATDLMYSLKGIYYYQQFMRKFFDTIKSGSIFIGIDVPLYTKRLPTNPPQTIDVRGSFNRFVRYVRNDTNGDILKSPSISFPREIAPDISRDHEILGQFNVKRTMKFHSFVVRKGE